MMEKKLKKLYKRGLLIWIIFFPIAWGYLVVNYLQDSAIFTIHNLGVLAFLFSSAMMLSIGGGLRLTLPVLVKDSVEERLKLFKSNHTSLKLVALFTNIILCFFIFTWAIIPIKLFPFWKVIAAGLIIGLLTSLLSIVIIKLLIKHYDNKKVESRFSFYDF